MARVYIFESQSHIVTARQYHDRTRGMTIVFVKITGTNWRMHFETIYHDSNDKVTVNL